MDNLQRKETPDIGTAQACSFRFDAGGGEYFRIWIVNFLLTNRG